MKASDSNPSRVTMCDRRRHFQTVMKHTRYSQVDVGTHRYPLRMLFGQDVDFALCAYNPRYERIPKQASTKTLYSCVACLSPDGQLTVTPWNKRESSARRAPNVQSGACVFAFRYSPPGPVPCTAEEFPFPRPPKGKFPRKGSRPEVPPEPAVAPTCQSPKNKEDPTPVRPPDPESTSVAPSCVATAGTTTDAVAACDCCGDTAAESVPFEAPQVACVEEGREGLEAVYEEVDWVTLEHLPVPSKSRGSVARQVESIRKVPFQLALASLREDRQAVRKELSAWLGAQADALDKSVGLIEVFTDKAPLARVSQKFRSLESIRLGTSHGQDFTRAKDRRLLLLLIGYCRPKDVWFSWPCSCWSGWARLNLAKGPPASEQVLSRRAAERPFLRLFEQAWSLQLLLGGHVHAENPTGSQAWQEINLGPAYEVNFHMCAVGMFCPKERLPILKPTRIVTSDPGLVLALRSCRCPGHSAHAHLEGGAKTKQAEVYPYKLCKKIVTYFSSRDEEVEPNHDIFLNTDDEADSEREDDESPDNPAAEAEGENQRISYSAMIQKLHVNTGHASVPQMLRLAQRARAPPAVVSAIRSFRCPVCEELQVPPSHKVAALRHTETPNHIVGLDVVQVELKRDGPEGLVEQKFNVLTAVDYASDFAQQILIPAGPNSVSRAFHDMWRRPYGPPRVVYVDPDQRWMSGDFQKYLRHNSITLLDSASESHWQLGRVEIAQKILRRMAQRVWRTADRPPHEVIECCAGVRNEQLKRHGFSSAQWFLGREPRVPGSLSDVTEQRNVAAQDAVLNERDFAQKMQARQQAAEAFIEAHAHTTWTRAIKGRSRPLRGPYVVGHRKTSRGLLSTRHGAWLGPGRVVGTESFREDSPVPRVIWFVVNGFMYKCSPECLRPIPEDEVAFRHAVQEFCAGRLPDELEQMTPARGGPAGRFFDLTGSPPQEDDFIGSEDSGSDAQADSRNVRRRITRSDEYWQQRASEASPRGPALVREREEGSDDSPNTKTRRVLEEDGDLAGYSPSEGPGEPPDQPPSAEPVPLAPDPLPASQDPLLDQEGGAEVTDILEDALCCEVSFDVFSTDIKDGQSLWQVLEECAAVDARPGQKRRVEVNFRKLGVDDRERFKQAMQKEWQSWLENKVTTIAKSKGIPRSRIIGSRWVLTWKKSSDPDVRTVSPKARLVLVGFQDPDLGRIATDSPTLRKESKHVILSICASMGWTIWGADIKTAFLSGDASNRHLFFKPPKEVQELMGLAPDDVLRLEKAAYGLAEAPRAWFLRLSRELHAVGMTVSQLDPCVFMLRCTATKALQGICGVHVDDLLGGGTPRMDTCLAALRKKLPFGDFRTKTIKYTGAEIRQLPDFSIEVSQEAYIEKLEEVSTKPFGTASEPLPQPTLMRACCGQLAWVANHSRPDQAFLASYLQGVQDRATVAHLALYNKAVREMKQRKVCLRFPRVPIESWRILAVTDAGWCVRESGESQGGLVLCLCEQKVLDREPGLAWIIEWSSKKLRRVVRSSTAAETLAAQNGLDAVEFAQAFLQEVLHGMVPREFQQWVPEVPSGLVIDSKSLYDALTRSACSSALAIEKRLAIDYAIARACLADRHVTPFWTNNLQMISDCLTKLKGNKDVLFRMMDRCMYHIRPSKESGRKEASRQGAQQ